eukprot:CAMPEP_0197910074 /NCGR_PEP_ID=MMETSP1439-20131203/70204_1 /TAXON_ID=66791 /ORGANISM="Gonyaulax spinifera, Strain CCMP409" /LENGTH=619 /DNA_ID=CAMNT_0043531693 /DNA_START=30 /DNA_END=1889 /DNA_ORIENTATION=-
MAQESTPVTAIASSVSGTKSNPLAFQFIKADQKAAHLAWKDLGFKVKTKQGPKTILKDVSGSLKPGKLTAILGPSGSGKTSLLNILAGRVKPGGRSSAEISGTISVNGNVVDPWKHQNLFGYVMQDDALFATSTPREVLMFSAKLRLQGVSKESMKPVLDDMIQSLGLAKCADTMVGDALIKGISGGERKRTAIGAELITNPKITFLDEPTSGLDSAASYNVINVLKELTRLEQSVLCTIHQPSSEIFLLFDVAIFLAAGRVAYQGPPSGIRPHFEQLGLVCPAEYNPADFVMFRIEQADEEQLERFTTKEKEARATVKHELDAQTPLPSATPTKGFFVELLELTKREARKTLRDKATLGARFGSTIFLTIIFGLIFFRIGDENLNTTFVDRTYYDFQSHAGATTMLGISGMFGAAQPTLLTFPSERPVFLREKSSNMYGVAPYFISKTFVEVPLNLLQALVQWLVAYWLMGLNGDFSIHVLATALVGLVSSSTSLLVGCLVADAKTATEAAPGLFVPQILFAGFFIKMELIPVFFRWLQYICPLKWAMNIILVNEFEEPSGPPGAALKPGTAPPGFFKANDCDPDDIGIYFGILLALFTGFRILGMIALSRKAKALYN